MSKFLYKITTIDDNHKKIELLSRFSRLSLSDQFSIALIISTNKDSIVDISWYKGNAILHSCEVTNNIAEDIIKILDKSKK